MFIYIHAPRVERNRYITSGVNDGIIYIHAPRVERNGPPPRIDGATKYLYPRAPYRAQRCRLQVCRRESNLYPRAPYRAQRHPLHRLCRPVQYIYIHAHRMERNFVYPNLIPYRFIYIHAPRIERNSRLAVSSPTTNSFISTRTVWSATLGDAARKPEEYIYGRCLS